MNPYQISEWVTSIRNPILLRESVLLLFLGIPQLVMASGSAMPIEFALIILFIPVLTFLSAIFIPIIIMYKKRKDSPRILLGSIGAVAPIALVGISLTLRPGSPDFIYHTYLGIPILYFLAFLTRKLSLKQYVVGITLGGLLIGSGMWLSSLVPEFQKPTEIRQLQRAIGQKLSETGGQSMGSYQLNENKQVVRLSLARMYLEKIPEEIGQLTQLQELDLSNNKLALLPKEIGQLTQLKRLILISNQLTQLPIEIGQLVQLEDLQLAHNELAQLPKEIGQLVQLEDLQLAYNRLAQLPKEIWQLTQLRALDLSYNELIQLPKEIGQLTRLGRLELSNNRLTQLPIEIGQLLRLTMLFLSDNQLTHLPKEIEQLTQLETLVLFNNPLPKKAE